MGKLLASAALMTALALSDQALAAEAKALECDGFLQDQGMNVSTDMKPLLAERQEARQQYVVGDGYVVISGGSSTQDTRLGLCAETVGQYRYADNCSIESPQRFAMDWLMGKDVDMQTSPFYKKYFPRPDSSRSTVPLLTSWRRITIGIPGPTLKMLAGK